MTVVADAATLAQRISQPTVDPVAVLREFTGLAVRERAAPGEQCEMCAAADRT